MTAPIDKSIVEAVDAMNMTYAQVVTLLQQILKVQEDCLVELKRLKK